MAKVHPSDDSFNVIVNVSPEAVGPLELALARLGYTKIRHELVSTIKTYKRNVQRTAPVDGVSNEEFVRNWVKNHPTFRAREVVQLLRDAERGTGSAAYHILTKLIEDKTLKQLSPGHYTRADVKQITHRKAKKLNGKSKHTGKGNTTRYAVSHSDTILKFGSKRVGGFTSSEVKRHFDKIGRPSGSVSTSLQDLVAKNRIKRIGEGTYEVIAAQANGDGTEAAHG